MEFTDSYLQEQLSKSHLTVKDKKAIAPFISSMNAADRQELMDLIAESADVAEKVQQMKMRRDEAMRELNKGFQHSTAVLFRTSVGTVRRRFEKKEKEDDAVELKHLESQIGTL